MGGIDNIIKISILKIGFIGMTTLIEAILDERASRKDITVFSVSSGSKMDEKSIKTVEEISSALETDLFLLVSPNASLPGPKAFAERLASRKPTILISDGPAKKMIDEIKGKLGYIIVEADPLIGVRKEFLDPVEMAIFNSDVIKVLSVTGAIRALHLEIDRVILELSSNGHARLPSLLITKDVTMTSSGFSNPYAKAKAMASYETARHAAILASEGAYREKNRERYLILVAAAHELLRDAARVADEARELEKGNDSVSRIIHEANGSQIEKKRLIDDFPK